MEKTELTMGSNLKISTAIKRKSRFSDIENKFETTNFKKLEKSACALKTNRALKKNESNTPIHQARMLAKA